VVVIAAKPGIGKTAMLIEQMEYTCMENPDAVGLMFSMEMPRFKIRRRTAMQAGHFDGRKFNTKKIDGEDLKTLYYVYREKMQALENLYVCAAGPMSSGQLEREIELFCRKEKKRPTIIGIDHLHTMISDDPHLRTQSNEHLTDIMIRAQKIASDYEVPVVVLAQLRKESYGDFDIKGNPRLPSAGDLKGAATSIEKAKTIILLHSIEVVRRARHVVPTQAIILKSNDGEEGVVKCLYVKPVATLVEETPQNVAAYMKLLERFGWKKDEDQNHGEDDIPF
jgi:replicative DNA helicase